MTYLTAWIVVIAAAAAAAGASWAICAFVSRETRQRRHEVAQPVFLQVGVMFSVLLAFVFSEVWGEYITAAQAINGECGALHGAAMLAGALPAGEGLPVERAIGAYVQNVVTVEWASQAHGRRSETASENFRAALTAAATLDATTPAGASAQSHILDLLTLAHADRETRLFQASQGLPDAVWLVLVVITLVLIGFVLFSGLDLLGHLTLSVAFTASTVGVLVLVKLLDYPFSGSLALGPEDFIKTLREVSALVAGG
ncbi:MAG: hypothetical protein ACR2F8_01790 [Caulobacteraceae bacterium]